MKRKIIIFGTTPYSESIYSFISNEERVEVLAFCSHRQYIKNDTLLGIPVVAFEDLNSLYDMSVVEILNTIGYTYMNGIRERVSKEIKQNGYLLATYISNHACVSHTSVVGEGSIIFPMVYVGPYVNIGNGNIIDAQTTLTHHISIGNYNFLCARVVSGGHVNIENNCFIGLGCVIRNGVNISSKTLIGSGTNITKSTHYNSVYLGNPASVYSDDAINVSLKI